MKKDILGKYSIRITPADADRIYKALEKIDVSALTSSEYFLHMMVIVQLEDIFDTEKKEREAFQDV